MSDISTIRSYSSKTNSFFSTFESSKELGFRYMEKLFLKEDKEKNNDFRLKYKGSTTSTTKSTELLNLKNVLAKKKNEYENLLKDYRNIYELYNNTYNDLYNAKSEYELIKDNNTNLKLLILKLMNVQ